ncbi:MAG: DUF4140 domain-containing protein [Promethearchaeota archaeon]
MKINPPHNRFIIFSGGGGLVLREQTIKLSAGRNVIEIQDVPSSFDEDTVSVELEGSEAELIQIVVKKPDRRFVEDAMQRERQASERILSESVDIRTELREELLTICEGIRSYRYEDSFSELIITIDSKKEEMGKIMISYFLDDGRIWWTPSIQVDIGENDKEARITGYILVENQTTLNFEDVELGFVEFEGVGRQAPPAPPSLGPPPPPGASAPAGPPASGRPMAQLRKEMMSELRKVKSIL